MSDIVEKTLLSLQSLLGGGRPTVTSGKARPGLENALEFATRLTSKHDEDMVIKKELSLLQTELAHPHLKSPQTRECLIRAIYCEMLGYPARFAHIHAIKQAQLGSVIEKRIGYLAATLMLHDSHELVILIINTIQKDLRSANVLNTCLALTACADLIGSEMASTVVDLIDDKLSHPNALVRRRAVLAIYHFLTVCPSSVRHLVPKIRACIGDRDPGVVAAVLNTLHFLALNDHESTCLDLVDPLVDIQRQIIRRKLPSSYDIRGVPVPYMQLRVLQILALVGRQSNASSQVSLIRDVVRETLQRADVNQNSAHAIVHQCICTASTVIGAVSEGETDDLLELAFTSLGRFLESSAPNMKYVGIKAFAQLVKCLSPEHLVKQQAVVMECLQSPDWSIRRNTFYVLFELTTASNVQIVCPKMLKHLRDVRNDFSKKEILKKIFDLAYRYRTSNTWFVEVANDLLMEAGYEILLPEVIAKLKEVLISKGPNDENFRTETVTRYLDYLERRHELQLSPQMLLLGCWTLSQLFRPASSNAKRICDVLAVIAREAATLKNRSDVATGALTALEYVVVRSAACDVSQTELELQLCLQSSDCAVKDRAHELMRVLRNVESVRPLFLDFSSAEEEDREGTNCHDWTLSFMDQFVVDAIVDSGESPYKAPRLRRTAASSDSSSGVMISSDGLLFDGAVDQELADGPPSSFSVSTISYTGSSTNQLPSQISHGGSYEVARKVWSKDGFLAFSEHHSTSTPSNVIILNSTQVEVVAENELLAKALFSARSDSLKQVVKTEVDEFPLAALKNHGDSPDI